MAKKAAQADKVAERIDNFERVARDKCERSFGPLFTPQLDRLSADDWETFARACRFKARDAIMYLALAGIDAKFSGGK